MLYYSLCTYVLYPPHVLEGERSTSEVAKGVLLATVKNMSKRGIVHTGAEVYKVHYNESSFQTCQRADDVSNKDIPEYSATPHTIGNKMTGGTRDL